jgi:sodium-dependent phosphate cotransporter
MGSNIGTSVTGILVSVTQAGEREHFEKAFSAATVHDMFNWLTVIVLLPVELITRYLERLTLALVNVADFSNSGGGNQKFLKVITEPFTNLIVQVCCCILINL